MTGMEIFNITLILIACAVIVLGIGVWLVWRALPQVVQQLAPLLTSFTAVSRRMASAADRFEAAAQDIAAPASVLARSYGELLKSLEASRTASDAASSRVDDMRRSLASMVKGLEPLANAYAAPQGQPFPKRRFADSEEEEAATALYASPVEGLPADLAISMDDKD